MRDVKRRPFDHPYCHVFEKGVDLRKVVQCLKDWRPLQVRHIGAAKKVSKRLKVSA